MLKIDKLNFSYGDLKVLWDIEMEVNEGEIVTVVGANGAGKSTLLLHLNGLPVTRATLQQVRRAVGFVFQDADDQLFMPTVQDDVAFGPLNLGLPAPQVQARVRAALEAVDALHLVARAPYRLSGGEKRAVAIAGVLAMQPSVLVLDEPSSGLDSAGRRRLIDSLRSLQQTRVIATHDLDLALEVCRRVLILHHGKVEVDGLPGDVFADRDLMQRCHLEPPPRMSARQLSSARAA
jgi:cobalt/nickel transport system ATP-binding protein